MGERGVMVLIVALVMWLIFAFAVGFYAAGKGRRWVHWALLALFVSPLIAFIVLAVLPVSSEALILAGKRKKCPQCGDIVPADANICLFCRSKFPAAQPKPGKFQPAKGKGI